MQEYKKSTSVSIEILLHYIISYLLHVQMKSGHSIPDYGGEAFLESGATSPQNEWCYHQSKKGRSMSDGLITKQKIDKHTEIKHLSISVCPVIVSEEEAQELQKQEN